MFIFTAVHYKSVPNFSTLSSRIQDVMIKAIAINSGYTSQVVVCIICNGFSVEEINSGNTIQCLEGFTSSVFVYQLYRCLCL